MVGRVLKSPAASGRPKGGSPGLNLRSRNAQQKDAQPNPMIYFWVLVAYMLVMFVIIVFAGCLTESFTQTTITDIKVEQRAFTTEYLIKTPIGICSCKAGNMCAFLKVNDSVRFSNWNECKIP